MVCMAYLYCDFSGVCLILVHLPHDRHLPWALNHHPKGQLLSSLLSRWIWMMSRMTLTISKVNHLFLCDMYSFRTLLCNRQRGIKKDSPSFCPETKPAYDTKAKRTTLSQERWLQPARQARTWQKQIKIWCTPGVVVCHIICHSNRFFPGWSSTGDGQVLWCDT